MRTYICRKCGLRIHLAYRGQQAPETCPKCLGEMRSINQFDDMEPHVLADMLEQMEYRIGVIEGFLVL